MKVAVLASGSKGNATFVDADGVRLLIDAGIGIRRLTSELRQLGTSPQELTAILITHEHSDHVRNLEMLLRYSDAPVYTRPKTWDMIAPPCPPERYRVLHDRAHIGGVAVRAFSVMHDVIDPVGYSIIRGDEQCTVATDLGRVTDDVLRELETATTVVLEANHDLAMLKGGEYPWMLKQRILGPYGHLANRDTAEALARLRHLPRRVLLAHISQQNNTPQLAHDTVADALARVGRVVPIAVTSQEHLVC